MTQRKRGKWLKTIGYNLVVVLLIFSGFEWYLNYQLNHPADAPNWLLPALKQYYAEYDRKVIQLDKECARFDSTLFYTLNPGTSTFSNREFSNQFEVNHLGVRDDEASLNAPKIIVLGDSYSMGWGVNQNETFPDLLEKKMGWTVLNAGVSSYGTAREFEALKRYDTSNLEFLIVQYCPNDFGENKYFVESENVLHVSNQEAYETHRDNHEAYTDYYPFKHVINIPGYLLPKEDVSKNGSPKSETPEKEEKPVVTANQAFLEVIKASKYLPKTTQIIVLSIEAEQVNAGFINWVKTALDKEYASSLHDRMSYVDLTGTLLPEHRFVLDPHLNAAGHAAVAEKLAAHLQALDLSTQRKAWFYESGDTSIACDYHQGYKEGNFTAYWPNGQASRVTNFHLGVKDGIETDFNDAGIRVHQKHYQSDLLHGWSIKYNALGEPSDSTFYQAGIIRKN